MSTLVEFILWASGTLAAGVLLCLTQPRGERAQFAIWCTGWQLCIWSVLGFTWALGWWTP